MQHITKQKRWTVALAAAVTGAFVVVAPTTATAQSPAGTAVLSSGGSALMAGVVEEPVHKFSVHRESLRGDTFRCDHLTLRVTRGRSLERTDADLRKGVARVSISRIGQHVRLHGSDGRTYKASGVTAAWFVLHAPDFETPVHGLEVNQLVFRGGPDGSPGWIRERIAWVDSKVTDVVDGPCEFA